MHAHPGARPQGGARRDQDERVGLDHGPQVPLDGGSVFRDGVEALLARLRRGLEPERRDRVVRGVSYAFALMILALILWQIIGPRLRF